jgi:hypothetical protein
VLICHAQCSTLQPVCTHSISLYSLNQSVLTQSVCTHPISLYSFNQSVLIQSVCTHPTSLYSFNQSVLIQSVCTHSISLYSLNQSVLTQSVCIHIHTTNRFTSNSHMHVAAPRMAIVSLMVSWRWCLRLESCTAERLRLSSFRRRVA